MSPHRQRPFQPFYGEVPIAMIAFIGIALTGLAFDWHSKRSYFSIALAAALCYVALVLVRFFNSRRASPLGITVPVVILVNVLTTALAFGLLVFGYYSTLR